MFRSPRSVEEAHSRSGAAVTAEGLGVRGPRGWAFRDVTVTAEPGALIAIAGPSGSGRTCLLLALTGRMRVAAGWAEVAGHRLPQQMTAVRRVTGLGPVPGVSDLEPSLTVAEQLRERALLARRFGSLRGLLRPRSVRAAESRARIADALARAGLDPATLPKGPRTAVRDLERLEALRLSVALALVDAPRLLAVDDTDLKLSPADRADAWAMLRAIAVDGTTVLAVCGEPPEDAVVVSTSRHARGRDGGPPTGAPVTDSTPDRATGPAAPPAPGPDPERGDEQRGTHPPHAYDKHEKGASDAIAEAGRT
ncbi:ATP-binding cassette domain-containing protein [Streptomyces sp. NPDC057702]|uniref:ATP-binding cassette domain-containing protein n=1 Tax=unclassified Streptomyces TaxID=2593676 RepID=UPI0036764865